MSENWREEYQRVHLDCIARDVRWLSDKARSVADMRGNCHLRRSSRTPKKNWPRLSWLSRMHLSVCVNPGAIWRTISSRHYRQRSDGHEQMAFDEKRPKKRKALSLWADYKDGFRPKAIIGKWRKDARGFNVGDGDDGSTWHISGIKFWQPLPERPKVSV